MCSMSHPTSSNPDRIDCSTTSVTLAVADVNTSQQSLQRAEVPAV